MLDFPKKSLAYLLETFCNVKAQKQYQLADWRIRPLTDEMTLYAKQDTHYLLYVYDVLRNKLATEAERLDVWNRSRQLCLQVYHKPAVPGPTVEDVVFEKVRSLCMCVGCGGIAVAMMTEYGVDCGMTRLQDLL